MHQSFRHAHLPYRVTSLILLLCSVAAELYLRIHQYLPLPLVPQFYRFELLPPSRLPLRTSTKFLYTHISIQCLAGDLIHVLTALLDQFKDTSNICDILPGYKISGRVYTTNRHSPKHSGPSSISTMNAFITSPCVGWPNRSL